MLVIQHHSYSYSVTRKPLISQITMPNLTKPNNSDNPHNPRNTHDPNQSHSPDNADNKACL